MLNRARPLASLTALLLSALLVAAAAAQTDPAPRDPQPAPELPVSQIIVQLRENSALADQVAAQPEALADRLSATVGSELSYSHAGGVDGMHLLALPTALPVAEAEALAALIAADPQVAYAEPDGWLFPALVPTDPRYAPDMWHLKPVVATASPGSTTNYGANLPPAWDVTTGSSSIVVAVIDTGGLLTHEDLTGRTIVGNPGFDMISNAAVGNDGNTRDADPSDPGDWITSAEASGGFFLNCPVDDSSWHGSHVAGTIGASANNGKGITGINWASRLLHLRSLGKCGGFTSDSADAIRWAGGLTVTGLPTNPNPARVINMSLGGSGTCGAATQSAIDAVTAAGAVVVVAAGNENVNLGTSSRQPANCNNVITVAATNQDGYRASYSNYGATVEIAAPGGNSGVDTRVMSVLNTGTQGPLADTYGAYSGTSMATPHVAGVVSLMLSVNPSLNRDQVLSILQSTATPFPSYSNCTTSICGAGVLNAGNAVEEAARRVRTLGFPSSLQVVNESAGTVNIPVQLSVPSTRAISVPFTVSGTSTAVDDHTLASGTLNIPIGASSATISFDIVADADAESAETLIITLGTPTGSPQPAALSTSGFTLTILDGETSTEGLRLNLPMLRR